MPNTATLERESRRDTHRDHFFVDFIHCPICGEETRHYSFKSPEKARRRVNVYCDQCYVVKILFKDMYDPIRQRWNLESETGEEENRG